MPSAQESWDKFVRIAWEKRDEILEPGLEQKNALKCVKNIYAYYNLGDLSKIPNWKKLLAAGSRAFMDKCGAHSFWVQGESNVPILGKAFGEAFAKLCLESLKVESFTVPPYSKLKSTLDIEDKKADLLIYKVLGKITEDDYKKFVGVLNGLTTRQKMSYDPALALNQFVWHCPPTKKRSGSKYRIYVAPTLEQTVPVFCDMVADMMNAPGELGSVPTALKVGTPTPNGRNRVDRIVVYCTDQTEMDGGVEWLRVYQEKNKGKFQAQLPLATKPVDGLLGVSVTPQPKPDHEIMKQAGRNKKNSGGISFGMSRSHVIYLGLRTTMERGEDFAAYKFYVEWWAKKAGLDIALENLEVG